MNRTQKLIWVCAVVLAYAWFDFAAPIGGSRGTWHYEISPSVVTLHVIVWAIIIIAAAAAHWAAGKKK
jgi:hypothetical protein